MDQTYSLIQTDCLLTVASWENRFIEGIEDLLCHITPKRIILFFSREYASQTLENRTRLAQLFHAQRIVLEEIELYINDPKISWRILVDSLGHIGADQTAVTIDISTMPREILWVLCHGLFNKGIDVQHIYHRPISYGDWLSRDPGRPRIVYKEGGIQHFGLPTSIVIVTGYDGERTMQLVRYFEPQKIYIGLQIGSQYKNEEMNRRKHEELLGKDSRVTFFDIDCYSFESTLNTLEKQISPLLGKANLLITSLGPKISALGLYAYKWLHEEIALVYAPSNEYNPEYSKGYQDRISGTVRMQNIGE